MSYAAFIGLYQLVTKPHYWEKTHHGLHLKKEEKKKRLTEIAESLTLGRPWFPKSPLSFPMAKWLLSKESVLIGALLASSLLNFVFNAYLGRQLSFEELGLVTFVNTLWYITMIFFSAFSTTLNHHTAYLTGKKKGNIQERIFSYSLKKGLRIMVGFSVVWFVFSPLLARFFQIESIFTLLLFTPVFIFGLITAASRGFFQGTFRFTYTAFLLVFEALIKLLIAIAFVSFEAPELVYLSIPASIFLSALLALFLSGLAVREKTKEISSTERFHFPKRFFGATLLSNVSVMVFLSFDVLLVKHYMDPYAAGEYALVSLAGKMIFFFGSLASTFLLTYVSRNEGRQVSSKKIFSYTYGATFFLVSVGVLVLGLFGDTFAPLLFGEKALVITDYLFLYTLSLSLFTLAGVVVTYHLARREYFHTFISLAGSLSMAAGIVFFHESLESVVWVIFFSSAATWGLVEFFHLFGRKTRFVARAFQDLFEIFSRRLLPSATKDNALGQRILIFNWRDMRHKFAGGAELYVEEIARDFVRQGNQVTLFCGNDGNSPRIETVEGVRIIRRGGFYLVYFWAFVYYMLRFRGRYDVIVDSQNGIPFFTPLYAKETTYCLMHHVHQEVFRRSLPWPLSTFARFLEKDLMPIVYKKVRFITVSESSRQEMEEIGLGQAGIEIVHPGVHLKRLAIGTKTPQPTILYLGRLKAYKSVDVLIRAFQMVVKERPEAKLLIAGCGEEEGYLKRLARDLRLNDRQIQFLGRVSEEEKVKLLQGSWVVVNPSFMEGWGIVVIEANACGTPVIASDIPGLRDSVCDTGTGYLVEYGDSKAFSEHILTIIRDAKLREALGSEARVWAERFDWQQSSAKFLAVISND